jgi:hypothetical protein
MIANDSRLSSQARTVMTRAEGEARRYNHEYTGTEHILLALIEEGGGEVAAAFRSHGVEPRNVRHELEKLVQRGPAPITLAKLPLTPRAAQAIEFADQQARCLQQDTLGPEHLVLGLLIEADGVAVQVLRNLGIDLRSLADELTKFHLAQLKLVERVVRPVAAGCARKRKMREELLAHLSSIYDEELTRLGDPATAIHEAARRFGDPLELSRELQSTLPAFERIYYCYERWYGWRAPESVARWMGRLAVQLFFLFAVMVVMAAAVVLHEFGWSANAWIAIRPLAAMSLLVAPTVFTLGLLYFKLRDTLFGVFGTHRSWFNALLLEMLFGLVVLAAGLAFVAFSEWDLTRAGERLVPYTAAALSIALGAFFVARSSGPTEIRDATWALLDIGQPAQRTPGTESN